ncbi:MAG: DNA repair protein RecO [Bacilli bacterium]
MIKEITGIVINERNYSDNDKIITIFCNDGSLKNIKVVSGRKFKNTNRSKTQMFCNGEFIINENINKFSVLKNAMIKNAFLFLKLDIKKYYYGIYFCEFITKIGYYTDLEEEVYSQFILMLSRLEKEQSLEEIRIVYIFVLLKYLGLSPHFDNCVNCGNNNVVSIDYKLGGFICNNCLNHNNKYDIKTLATIKKISMVDFKKLGKINLSSKVIYEIDFFLDKYIAYHLNIKLNSKAFL